MPRKIGVRPAPLKGGADRSPIFRGISIVYDVSYKRPYPNYHYAGGDACPLNGQLTKIGERSTPPLGGGGAHANFRGHFECVSYDVS